MAADAPRLSLFVPGLFDLPLRDTPQALLAGMALPVLGRILGRAAIHAPPATGFEATLFSLFDPDADPAAMPSVAAATATLDGVAAAGRWLLRADPVHLRADTGKAILFAADAFSIDAEEARLLAHDIAPLFADRGWGLETPAADRWYLVSGTPLTIEASSLARVQGADIRRHLPGGEQGVFWRRVHNEIQMTLHEHPVNQDREQRGEPVINSLWIWGAGEPLSPGGHRWDGVWGDDVLLQALAGDAWRGASPGAAGSLQALAPGRYLFMWDDPWLAACYGDAEGWRAAIARLEAEWLAPLWERLRARDIAEVILHSGRHRIHLGPREARRWWRRRVDPVDAPLWAVLER